MVRPPLLRGQSYETIAYLMRPCVKAIQNAASYKHSHTVLPLSTVQKLWMYEQQKTHTQHLEDGLKAMSQHTL